MNATQQGASPAWYAIILSLAGAVALVADGVVHPLLPWWAWPAVAFLAGAVTFIITLMQMDGRAHQGWTRVFAYRELVWIGLAVGAAWADAGGWTVSLALWWAGGTTALGALGVVCPTPPRTERAVLQPGWDRRPEYARVWEGHI